MTIRIKPNFIISGFLGCCHHFIAHQKSTAAMITTARTLKNRDNIKVSKRFKEQMLQPLMGQVNGNITEVRSGVGPP